MGELISFDRPLARALGPKALRDLLPTAEDGCSRPLNIATGFPLRRCSWKYDPIVSVTLTRKMIRWLDCVCAGRATS
jgi:hypothetical protein